MNILNLSRKTCALTLAIAVLISFGGLESFAKKSKPPTSSDYKLRFERTAESASEDGGAFKVIAVHCPHVPSLRALDQLFDQTHALRPTVVALKFQLSLDLGEHRLTPGSPSWITRAAFDESTALVPEA